MSAILARDTITLQQSDNMAFQQDTADSGTMLRPILYWVIKETPG